MYYTLASLVALKFLSSSCLRRKGSRIRSAPFKLSFHLNYPSRSVDFFCRLSFLHRDYPSCETNGEDRTPNLCKIFWGNFAFEFLYLIHWMVILLPIDASFVTLECDIGRPMIRIFNECFVGNIEWRIGCTRAKEIILDELLIRVCMCWGSAVSRKLLLRSFPWV